MTATAAVVMARCCTAHQQPQDQCKNHIDKAPNHLSKHPLDIAVNYLCAGAEYGPLVNLVGVPLAVKPKGRQLAAQYSWHLELHTGGQVLRAARCITCAFCMIWCIYVPCLSIVPCRCSLALCTPHTGACCPALQFCSFDLGHEVLRKGAY